FGGSIGVLFYAANIGSSALYAVACTECLISSFGAESGTFATVLPEEFWYKVLYRVLISLLNFSIFLLSVIFCTLTVLVSFFSDSVIVVPFNGTSQGTFTGLLAENWSFVDFEKHLYPTYSRDCNDEDKPVSFAIVFAVLFSGVTGIMAGANLSGDLRAPSKSIPKGTLLACFFTFLTYVVLFVFTAMTCDKELLLQDCAYMMEFNLWKPFVIIGNVLATFCASAHFKRHHVWNIPGVDIYGTVGNNPLLAVAITWLLSNIFSSLE
ncbi:Solute carrier family 12 member 9like, partial [Caligus rogercresseyi]